MLAYHAGTFTGVTWGPDASYDGWGPWVQHLNVGVSVFFVLSGFLLFRPFVRAHLEGRPGPAILPYLGRRLVRIYPAYWVALFISTRVVHLDLGDWWGHLRFYGLLQIYWGDTVLGGLVQAWSLCTEVSFYLFLPVWAAVACRGGASPEQRARRHYLALAGLYLVGVVTRAQLRAGDHAIGYATLPANADLFAIGMALAVAHSLAKVTGRAPGGLARTVGDQPSVAWIAALCCYAGAVSLRYPFGLQSPTVFQEVMRQVLFGVIAGLLVSTGVFGPQDRGAVRHALRWKPLAAIGVVSYGVYLWHLTVMQKLASPGSFIAPARFVPLVAWTTAFTLVVASASWFGLERPLLRRVHAWSARRTARSRDADPQPSSSLAP